MSGSGPRQKHPFTKAIRFSCHRSIRTGSSRAAAATAALPIKSAARTGTGLRLITRIPFWDFVWSSQISNDETGAQGAFPLQYERFRSAAAVRYGDCRVVPNERSEAGD